MFQSPWNFQWETLLQWRMKWPKRENESRSPLMQKLGSTQSHGMWKNQLQVPHWHSLESCAPKNSTLHPQSSEFLAAGAQILPKFSGPAAVALLCFGQGSNQSFPEWLHSHIIHLWEAHSMASSLSGNFGEVSGQPCDEVVDPRCLDLPLASGSLWRPLLFQINVQFGRVRVPPAASGCGDGIIIPKKLLTSQSWKLWPRWKGKSL